jgi:hypothetical protein
MKPWVVFGEEGEEEDTSFFGGLDYACWSSLVDIGFPFFFHGYGFGDLVDCTSLVIRPRYI